MPGENKTFLEHLEELRGVLLRSLAAVALLLFPAYWAAGRLIPWLLHQLEGLGGNGLQFHYFSPLEPFLVQLKCSLLLALFGALPYVSWQVGGFIAPGLYRRERRLFGMLAGAAFLLFLAGAAFAFTLILPLLLRFAASYRSPELAPILGLGNFVDLAGLLLLGFGIMFQLPVVVVILVRTGLVRTQTLRKSRPVVVIAILVLAAVLTPPDVISQLLMAVPTWLLFELALLLAARLEPPAEPESAEDAVSSATPPVASSAPDTIAAEYNEPHPIPEDDAYAPYAAAARSRRGRRIRPIRRR